VRVCVRACMRARACARVRACACACVCACLCMCECVCVCMCMSGLVYFVPQKCYDASVSELGV